ncbi:MAG: hypothetical protein ACLT1T_12355 [Oscillospiraceae bacterium]
MSADKKRFTKHAVSISAASPQSEKQVIVVEDIWRRTNTTDVRIEVSQRPLRETSTPALPLQAVVPVDPEINHGIDQLIASFGLAVSEDAVWQLTDARCMCSTSGLPLAHVRRQHVAQENAQLIQLVSFGCGIDAITTDEMRAICENGAKFHTAENRRGQQPRCGKNPYPQHAGRRKEGRKLAEQQNA